MTEVTLSEKNRIVIPREARQALGLRAGDKLLVVIRADRMIVLQKPKSHYQAISRVIQAPLPEGLPEERTGELALNTIALDTSIFIYAVEAHPKYAGVADQVFGWLEEP